MNEINIEAEISFTQLVRRHDEMALNTHDELSDTVHEWQVNPLEVIGATEGAIILEVMI